MVLFNLPKGETKEIDFFEDGKIRKIKFGEPFVISGNSTLDLPQSEEIVGVIACSVRTEALAPRLKEIGFPLREDSHSTPGGGIKLV